MIPINNKPNLVDFMEDKGCTCAVCFDPYNPDDANKAPTPLSGCQHAICIQCFKEMPQRLCPTCRAPFKADTNPPKDIVRGEQVRLVKELWNSLYGQNHSAAAVSNDAAAEAKAPTHPDNWSVLTWSDQVKMIANRSNRIPNAFPHVVSTMGWQEIYKALKDEYQVAPHQWVVLESTEDNSVKAIAWLQPKGAGAYEVHWTGLTERNTDTDYYLAMFQAILFKVRKLTKDINTSVSYYLHFNNESPQFQSLMSKILQLGLRFDVQTDVNRGKAKLTVYPRDVSWTSHEACAHPEGVQLVSDSGLKEQFESVKHDVLEGKTALRAAIVMDLAGKPKAKEKASKMQRAFLKHPERFFAYCIDNKAAGYVRLGPRVPSGALQIAHIGMHPVHKQFKRHLLCEFLTWALNKPTLADQPAQSVSYESSWEEADSWRDSLMEAASHLGLKVQSFLVDGRLRVQISK